MAKTQYGSTITSTYEFGNDKYGSFIHYESDGDQYWYSHNADGEVVGLCAMGYNEGQLSVPYSFSAQSVNGIDINGLLDDYDTEYYGAEGLLAGMYTLGKENQNKDYAEKAENGEYSFSFGYAASYNFYIVKAGWTLGEGGSIETAAFSFDSYSNDSYITDDTDGTISIIEGSSPSETLPYSFTQEEGTKDAENPYDVETFYFTTWQLYNGDEAIGANVNISAGYSGALSLTLNEPTPSTAQAFFDTPTVTVKDSEGNDSKGISGYYSSYDNAISLQGNDAGDYIVTVATKNVSQSFAAHVAMPSPTEFIIMPLSQSEDGGWNSNVIETGETTNYIGNQFYFSYTVMPYNADGSATISCDDPKVSINSNPDPITSAWTGEVIDNVFLVEVAEAGDYTITVTSSVDTSVSTSFVFHVLAPLTYDKVFSGSYINVQKSYMMDLSAGETENTGTMKLTDISGKSVSSFSMVYDPTTRGVTLTLTSGNAKDVSLTISNIYDYDLTVGVDSFRMVPATPIMLASGSWSYTAEDGTNVFAYMNTNACADITIMGDGSYSSVSLGFSLTFNETEKRYYVAWSTLEYTTPVDFLDLNDTTSYFNSNFSVFFLKNALTGEYIQLTPSKQ